MKKTTSPATHNRSKLLTQALVFFVVILYFTLVPAITQDPNYHCFAGDEHSFGSIPRFLNVASNLFFCFAGIIGWCRLRNWEESPIKTRWQIFYFGIFCVGLGSGYYHYHPTTFSLFWDRLPMTIGFTALVANLLADRFAFFQRKSIFWLLIFFGAYSTFSWILTEIWGRGDLRFYVLVQFGTMLLAFLALYRFPRPGDKAYWMLLGGYTLAKIFEAADFPIYEITHHLVSGHVLKHLTAGIALCFFFPKKFSRI